MLLHVVIDTSGILVHNDLLQSQHRLTAAVVCYT